MTDVLAEPLLRVRDLKVEFKSSRGKSVKAVDKVSLELAAGETLGLVGESGSGKSTTGRAILRKFALDRGTVEFQGDDISDLRGAQLQRMRRNMQLVFQDPYSSLSPRMSVFDIIAEPLLVHGLSGGRIEARRKVGEALEMVGLPAESMARTPQAFSGGQRQRIGIARSLILKPSLIVADEPVSALDVSVQAQVVNLLQDLQRDVGMAYLFIAHDLAVVRHISHRIAIMYAGQIVETAKSEDIYTAPKHPYTRALLSAVPLPDPQKRNRDRIVLSGEVSSPVDVPTGCRFASRCPWSRPDICTISAPELRQVGGHEVACHFAENLGDRRL